MNKILKITSVLLFLLFLASVTYSGIFYFGLEDAAKNLMLEMKNTNTKKVVHLIINFRDLITLTAGLALLTLVITLFSASRQSTNIIYIEKANNDTTQDENTTQTDEEILAAQKQKIAEETHDFKQKLKQLDGKTDAEILKLLCHFMDAGQGMVWDVNEQEVAQPGQTFALIKSDLEGMEIKVGEGLVGQAMANKSIITIANVPQTYFELATGLGSTKPKALMLMPLLNNSNQVTKVIELALFKVPDENMQQLAENINNILNEITNS